MKKVRDNCINCMYSEYTKSTIMINDRFDQEYMKCTHQNSPFYDEFVNDKISCRLYVDSEKYFLRKDRKDKLDKINNNGSM